MVQRTVVVPSARFSDPFRVSRGSQIRRVIVWFIGNPSGSRAGRRSGFAETDLRFLRTGRGWTVPNLPSRLRESLKPNLVHDAFSLLLKWRKGLHLMYSVRRHCAVNYYHKDAITAAPAVTNEPCASVCSHVYRLEESGLDCPTLPPDHARSHLPFRTRSQLSLGDPFRNGRFSRTLTQRGDQNPGARSIKVVKAFVLDAASRGNKRENPLISQFFHR